MKRNININKVEQIRLSNEKTKTEMAALIGCSERSYQNKINNVQPFKLSEVIKLIENFGVKFEDLL